MEATAAADSTTATKRERDDRIGVTVLSGFLGSGKTTLLSRLLTEHHGKRLAVIVNDMAELNVDARMAGKLVQTEQRLVSMQNGCICCTLREDLLEQVSALAKEKKFDYIVIESTGVSEPLPVAETFTFEVDPEAEPASGDDASIPASLDSVARLDTMVTVVDGSSFLRDLDTLDSLSDRGWQDRGGPSKASEAPSSAPAASGTTPPPPAAAAVAGSAGAAEAAAPTEGDGTAQAAGEDAEADGDGEGDDEEDEDQGISSLLVDQVEFANVVIINKCDLVTPEELARVKAVVHGLNPGAAVLEAVRGNVPVDKVINTHLFSMEEASNAAGWLKEARGEHTPETEEYGVSSFVFRARRPFHPARLATFLDSDAFSSGKQHGLGTAAPGSAAAEGSGEAEAHTPTADEGDEVAQAAAEPEAESKTAETAIPAALAKAAAGKCGFVVRSKGMVWLAGGADAGNAFLGEWSHAGRRVELVPMLRWVAASLKPDELPDAGEDVAESWSDEPGVGDRRVELVIIGLSMDKEAMRAALEACLVTEEEWKLGPAGWASFEDPIWGEMDWETVNAAMDAAEADEHDHAGHH